MSGLWCLEEFQRFGFEDQVESGNWGRMLTLNPKPYTAQGLGLMSFRLKSVVGESWDLVTTCSSNMGFRG